ncbi:MAG: DUF1824 family protein [Leptolyngbya sp. SIO4C1]|nr:DUF1824 family protein [Leptolyngbya sp. SIO4C1]
MSKPLPTPDNIQAVRQQLARFSSLHVPPQLSTAEQQSVQTALLWFSDLADYETIGVCAATLAEGKAALEQYVGVFARPITLDLPAHEGAVFLKFNTLKGAWYLDDYTGASRGVLVSFHVSEAEAAGVMGTYGPFPLDLFTAQ